jgi:hypothetical protein
VALLSERATTLADGLARRHDLDVLELRPGRPACLVAPLAGGLPPTATGLGDGRYRVERVAGATARATGWPSPPRATRAGAACR